MGSGLSDLSKVSPSTLFDEVRAEYGKQRLRHESLEAKASGAVATQKRPVLDASFAQLTAAFDAYAALYKEFKAAKEAVALASARECATAAAAGSPAAARPEQSAAEAESDGQGEGEGVRAREEGKSAEGQGQEAALQQSALAANNVFCEYVTTRRACVFEEGDIVQVRDPVYPALFVEAVVFNAHGCTVEARVENDEMESFKSTGDEWRRVDLDADAGDAIRKVKGWASLETGDRVRVKEGCLAFQGVVESVSDDRTEVTVRFDSEDDEHAFDDDDVEFDEESTVQTFPAGLVEKVDTGRFARLRFKDTVKRVQKSISVAHAFMDAVSPRCEAELTGAEAEAKVQAEADVEPV